MNGITSHLKERRAAAGLSQQALADAVGLARPRIAEYETGAIDFSRAAVAVALRIAAALGCTVEELFSPPSD